MSRSTSWAAKCASLSLTVLISVFASVSLGQGSHGDCPSERGATAVLIKKRFSVSGQVICSFAYRDESPDSDVPFPLRYLISDCTEYSENLHEHVAYRGWIYYEYQAPRNDQEDKGYCSAKLKVVY